MNWFKPFEDDLAAAFSVCEARLSELPAPLNEIGLSYLRKFDVFEQDSSKNYICYLLPFWMKELTALPADVYRHLSAANIIGMLYYFIQDDIMDSPHDSQSPIDPKHHLALANLLYYEFLTSYQPYFSANSDFWSYFKNYTHEWSEGVLHETRDDYFKHNRAMIAKKAAPVKLGSTAALLLSDQAGLIPRTNDVMNHVLLTLQMMDDWTDWKQDLADGSYNCLLSLIKSELGRPREANLTLPEVQEAIYVNNMLKPYADIAAATHAHLLSVDIDAPHLISFHQTMVDELQAEANHIENSKETLSFGGLNYYLSILSKK
ncbi:class 1 isoprenoid biosynthesis enzyme [Paenibacillus lautus]|uniref:class 1 isoprenoid biosynthesis enzyme n=1 Tax=Paenibacillus lautus TaxID=1401 RepID=UPI000FDC22B7|nr:class 1 isoprenoid biosynthesis enzyme [Paenibacillus lautus]